jgi:hypothetical protein
MARLLGVEHTVIEQVAFDEEAEAIVALVRPARGQRGRCGICGRPSLATTTARDADAGARWISG